MNIYSPAPIYPTLLLSLLFHSCPTFCIQLDTYQRSRAMATAYAPAPVPMVGGTHHQQQQQQPGGGEKIKPMSNNKKDKEVPPSPPVKIRDAGNGVQYTRMGFLGEVSFPSLQGSPER
jgi:hypothetical protein